MERKKELRKHIATLKTHYNSVLPGSRYQPKYLPPSKPIRLLGRPSTVLLYYSLKDEVDTHTFVQKWSKKKRILLPVVVGDDLELRIYTVPGRHGNRKLWHRRTDGELFTDYATIDFIAVPGVAFDLKGNRLGRGKGYYDRLLPRIPSAYKAGICFPFQLVEEVPAESFDIRMDIIITINEK